MAVCTTCGVSIPIPDRKGIQHLALIMPKPIPLEDLEGKDFCSAVCLEKWAAKKKE